MAARVSWSIALAGVALGLAGCAGTPPPEPAAGSPPCDLICTLLQVFAPTPPPPAPAPEPVAATEASPPPPPSKKGGRHRHARASTPARAMLNAPLRRTAPETEVPPETSIVPETPQAATVPTVAASPVPPAPGHAMLQPLSGSPGITPPWFEPWTQP